MNPALAEMFAKDRIAELRQAAAQRSLRTGAEIAPRRAWSGSSRRAHLTNPQRAIGWFLVSVGLRLALPRTRTGSAR